MMSDRHSVCALLVLLAVTCASSIGGAEPVAGAHVALVRYSQDHGTLQLDRSFAGKPLKIGSGAYAHGLGTSAPSLIEVRLGPECRAFVADVGVDANARQAGVVVLVVIVDGQARFRSEILRRGMEPVPVSVDLRGAKTLKLVADPVGAPAGDHVDWANARVVLADGKEVALSQVVRRQGVPTKGDAIGQARRKARTCTVTDYGAAGDGEADDSAAFQLALNDLATAGKGVLRIPAGDYRIDRRVSVELAGANVSIVGDGQGVSALRCHNPDGAFRLRDEWCKSQITLRELSFFAEREGAGTAIEVSSPPRGVRNYRTLLVQNVEIRGAGLPTRKYFNCGIKAIAQWRPLFLNVIVSGVADPALKGDHSDDSPAYRCACGIQADWCYAPSFQHCYVWSAHTGYRIISKGRPEGPEDCAFYRSNAVGCRVGIDVSTPIPEPQLVIDACHINCRDVGIRLHNRKFFQIRGNLLYSTGYEADHPYRDIMLVNSFKGAISGNIFHSPARHVYRPQPAVDRTMVHVDGKCRDVLITDNVFNAKGLALRVEDGAKRIVSRDNLLANAQTVWPDGLR